MRVLLADDHGLLLEGLANLLAAHGIEVAGMARDGLQAVSLARQLKPDIILMDLRMPGCDGLCATRQIMAEMPEMKIVVLTTSSDDNDLFEAVKSGACGYLLKSMDADELVECLDQAEAGIPPFSPGLAAKILNEFARVSLSAAQNPKDQAVEAAEQQYPLTQRQLQVLELVAKGYSYKEVGKM